MFNFESRLLISGISLRSKKTIKGGVGRGAGRTGASFASQRGCHGLHGSERLITAGPGNVLDEIGQIVCQRHPL